MLNTYGLLISISVLVCALILKRLIRSKNENVFWGLVFWATFSGLVGARIYHVIDYWEFYGANPLNIIKIWNGGMGIWGAIIGGILGSLFYLRKRGEDMYQWLDPLSVVLPLGQAIGRWGNYFNQEIFGKPTNLPWGVFIEPDKRPVSLIGYNKFHPLFIYESLLDLFLFIILLKLYTGYKNKLQKGIIFSLYLGGYSVIRYFLEYLRINPWGISFGRDFNLNVSQCVSILVLSFSIVFIKLRTNKK